MRSLVSVRIPLANANLRARADKLADQVSRTETLQRTRNYTGLERPERYRTGYLGELAFQTLLEDEGIRYSVTRKTDGMPDLLDFTVWRGKQPFSLDVKTAGQLRYQLCMMPEAQFQRKHCELYVAVRLEEGADPDPAPHAHILGFATLADVRTWTVRDYGHGVPTRAAAFQDMRPIGVLLDHLYSIF